MTDLAGLPSVVLDRIAIATPDDCWLWLGPRDEKGYGRTTVDGTFVRIARLVLAYVTGTSGEQALHSCDNPPCVNPHHLRWGSNSDNQRDAVTRGRHRTGRETWTHCVAGHEFTAANTRIRPTGARLCRTCERNRTRRYRQEKAS